MFFDGSLLARGARVSPEMLCEEGTVREREKAVPGQGCGCVAPGACWDSGGRNSAARPRGKEEVCTKSANVRAKRKR